jgi:hypothetical protein
MLVLREMTNGYPWILEKIKNFKIDFRTSGPP